MTLTEIRRLTLQTLLIFFILLDRSVSHFIIIIARIAARSKYALPVAGDGKIPLNCASKISVSAYTKLTMQYIRTFLALRF